jgi:hypothetical protein
MTILGKDLKPKNTPQLVDENDDEEQKHDQTGLETANYIISNLTNAFSKSPMSSILGESIDKKIRIVNEFVSSGKDPQTIAVQEGVDVDFAQQLIIEYQEYNDWYVKIANAFKQVMGQSQITFDQIKDLDKNAQSALLNQINSIISKEINTTNVPTKKKPTAKFLTVKEFNEFLQDGVPLTQQDIKERFINDFIRFDNVSLSQYIAKAFKDRGPHQLAAFKTVKDQRKASGMYDRDAFKYALKLMGLNNKRYALPYEGYGASENMLWFGMTGQRIASYKLFWDILDMEPPQEVQALEGTVPLSEIKNIQDPAQRETEAKKRKEYLTKIKQVYKDLRVKGVVASQDFMRQNSKLKKLASVKYKIDVILSRHKAEASILEGIENTIKQELDDVSKAIMEHLF